VPMNNTKTNTFALAKTIEWCENYLKIDKTKQDYQKTWWAWNTQFCKKMTKDQLFSIATTADYLDIKPLLNDVCKFIAEGLKEMSVQEIRTYFDVKDDYTPEEYKEVERENAWLEDTNTTA